jgi:tetratricopeptide (TPR) repeat protein
MTATANTPWRVPGEGGADKEMSWPVRLGAVPALADGFIARPTTAPDLRAALSLGSTVTLEPSRASVGGAQDWLGSCGRTQLAVSCAESLWRTGEIQLLIWVVATNRASVLSAYVEAAVTAMGADPAADAELVAARFLSWLGETSRPWLVVLDDLSDATDLDGLWPQGPAGRVLITTADSANLPSEQLAPVHPVGVFSTRESLSYLRGRLTTDPDQRLGAIDLVEELGCHPLALSQASLVIAGSGISCQDYRDYFVHRRKQMTAMGGEPPHAAAVTWAISLEQADQLMPGGNARFALALAALLDGHGTPGTVFTTSAAGKYLAADGAYDRASPERLPDALLVLEQVGLLTIDRVPTPLMVRMHPVIQAAIRTAMPAEVFNRAVRAAADALLEVWPEDDLEAWRDGDLRRSESTLQGVAGDLLYADGYHALLPRAGRSLESARLSGPAVAYWSELAEVGHRVLGPNHPDTLLASQHLADAYLAVGLAAEACPWFWWIANRQARVLGPDHPGTVWARRNLGHALVAANQISEALPVLEAVAGDYERIRGADHTETLDGRDELAAAYHAAEQFTDATRLYRRTLADRERIQGRQHPDTMTTRQKLAAACLADGQLKDAISHYKRVLAGRERALGPDNMDTIAARGHLADAYHSAGRMASALQLYEQTCADYERILGADHPDTLSRRADLANVYYQVGRLSDSMTLLQETLALCDRVLPPGDPLMQAARERLTNIARGAPTRK